MSLWQQGVRGAVSRWLRVPSQPQVPGGSPGTARIFRAAPSYFRLSQLVWGLKQVWLFAAAIGFLLFVHHIIERGDHSFGRRDGRFPAEWITPLLYLVHLIPLGIEILSLPFTYALVWLDYDQRWYIVTDRSLRIREGVVRVREMTLSFANIQQITVRQGPLQRFLGISDLVVTTAGGGAGVAGKPGHSQMEPVHTGILRGVDNAEEVRDLILARMRALKDAGLGDPDDVRETAPIAPMERAGLESSAGAAELTEAAEALIAEARRLRTSLGGVRPQA